MAVFSGNEMKRFVLHPSAAVLCPLYQMPDMIQCFCVEVMVIFNLKLNFHMCKPYQGLQVHVRKAQETGSLTGQGMLSEAVVFGGFFKSY